MSVHAIPGTLTYEQFFLYAAHLEDCDERAEAEQTRQARARKLQSKGITEVPLGNALENLMSFAKAAKAAQAGK